MLHHLFFNSLNETEEAAMFFYYICLISCMAEHAAAKSCAHHSVRVASQMCSAPHECWLLKSEEKTDQMVPLLFSLED